MPPEIAEDLRARHRSNLGRSMLLREQIVDVTGRLAGGDVDSLLLKGAAHLADGVLPDLGAREMSDIDILIRPDQLAAAEAALASAGYRRQARPYGLEHHDVVFLSPDALAPVEIHVAVGPPEVARVLPAAPVWSRARAVELSGTPVRVLGREDTIVHHILHAQVQDRDHAFFGVPLRQLHTFALLGRAWGHDLDDAAVVDRITRAGFRAPMLGHVDLSRRIFGEAPLRGLRIPRRIRAHRTVGLGSFALGWPTDLARNLRWAFDVEYLAARYHGRVTSRRERLALRARHARTLVSSSSVTALSEATARRR